MKGISDPTTCYKEKFGTRNSHASLPSPIFFSILQLNKQFFLFYFPWF